MRAVAPSARAGGSSSSSPSSGKASPRKRGGSKASPVPDADAQLLRSLGLDGTVDPAALPQCLVALPVVRRMLDHTPAVAAHLLSPAVGLTAQEVGQLLEGCPELFTWPPEERAAPLFGNLLGAGLTAAEAAQCFIAFPEAAESYSFDLGLTELAAVLVHSRDRGSSQGGPAAKVPAVWRQRSVAALLSRHPRALALACQGDLSRLAGQMQEVGLAAADVAELAWEWPDVLAAFLSGYTGNWWVLRRETAAIRRDRLMALGPRAAVLQTQLGFAADEAADLLVHWGAALLDLPVDAVEARAAALVEVSQDTCWVLPRCACWACRACCAWRAGHAEARGVCALLPCGVQLPQHMRASSAGASTAGLVPSHSTRGIRPHAVAGLWPGTSGSHSVEEQNHTLLRAGRVAALPVLHGGLRRGRPQGSAAAAS